MKKQTGIWLDFKEASIIALEGKNANTTKIRSEIEDFHPKGGARSKTPWGPMDKMSERKYLERRKQQEKAYYEKLIAVIKEADELYIFGPAEAKFGLLQAIKNNHSFHPHLKGIEPADSITDNQKVAKVKAVFGSK